MRATFVGVGWTDAAVVGNSTASGTNAPAENLLTDRRSEFWRTSSNVNFAFAHFDLGEIQPVNTVGLIDVFGPSTEDVLVTVWVADTEAELTTGPRTSFGFDHLVPLLADGSRQFLHSRLMSGASPVNARWVRIVVEHGTTAVQPLGASRLVVGGPGSEFIPPHGVLVGSDVVTPSSRSEVTETDAGSVFVRHLYTRRTAGPRITFDRDTYLGDLWDLLAFSGSNRPILFAQQADLDYGAATLNAQQVSKQMIYGRLPNPNGIRGEFATHSTLTLELEEWT